MSRSSNYNTKQKEEILSYLKSLNGNHVTVQQVVDHFEKVNNPIGMTTIYRYLEKLEKIGIVKRYIIDGVSGACFQYAGDKNQQCNQHFHFKCESCGQLIHFECKELEGLQTHLLGNHGFDINSLKTVFYGKCDKCSIKG